MNPSGSPGSGGSTRCWTGQAGRAGRQRPATHSGPKRKRPPTARTVDHDIPVALGGTAVVPCCSLCSSLNGALIFDSIAEIQDSLLDRLLQGHSVTVRHVHTLRVEQSVLRDELTEADARETMVVGRGPPPEPPPLPLPDAEPPEPEEVDYRSRLRGRRRNYRSQLRVMRERAVSAKNHSRSDTFLVTGKRDRRSAVRVAQSSWAPGGELRRALEDRQRKRCS